MSGYLQQTCYNHVSHGPKHLHNLLISGVYAKSLKGGLFDCTPKTTHACLTWVSKQGNCDSPNLEDITQVIEVVVLVGCLADLGEERACVRLLRNWLRSFENNLLCLCTYVDCSCLLAARSSTSTSPVVMTPEVLHASSTKTHN